MTRFACWKIRGLNTPIKQNEVRWFILLNKIDFMVVLEIKVRDINVAKVCHSIWDGWEYCTNHVNGLVVRIWIG